MVQRSGWMWTSAALSCIIIVSLYFAAFFYTEYDRYQQLYNDTLLELQKYEPYMFVNLLFDYGNGTQVWCNNTLVAKGANLLNASGVVAEVDYSLGQWGAFVTNINGVGGDPNTYWIYNVWNSTSSSWEYGPVGADVYILTEGEIVSWTYQKF